MSALAQCRLAPTISLIHPCGSGYRVTLSSTLSNIHVSSKALAQTHSPVLILLDMLLNDGSFLEECFTLLNPTLAFYTSKDPFYFSVTLN